MFSATTAPPEASKAMPASHIVFLITLVPSIGNDVNDA
jgi:hypothetical protein